jgi:hypothetical protein
MKKQIKWIILLALTIVAAVKAQNPDGMTGEVVPQSQSVLDGYFVTNAIPGQLQYYELIDTMFWYIGSTYTNSLAAAQSAQQSQAANDRKWGSLYLSFGDGGGLATWQLFETNGFSSNSISWGNFSSAGNNFIWLWITNYFVPKPATFPPVFWTVQEPPYGGGELTNSPIIVLPPSGANTVSQYVQSTNYVAFYLVINETVFGTGTNLMWFTFYQ